MCEDAQEAPGRRESEERRRERECERGKRRDRISWGRIIWHIKASKHLWFIRSNQDRKSLLPSVRLSSDTRPTFGSLLDFSSGMSRDINIYESVDLTNLQIHHSLNESVWAFHTEHGMNIYQILLIKYYLYKY